ncbi:MAG: cysteine synthase A [Acidobacteria bacterium]|nr:cysteine synthase A [Acidobacteriota bacterium]
MKYNNILQTIGNTPLVKIGKIDTGGSEIYAKIEARNPGGSVKDRIALAMIEDAKKKGILRKGDTIIEPTSGNTGIGIAMVAAYKGYKAVFTMPETMSVERRKLLRFLGAEIILTPGKLGMKGAVEKAEELVRTKGYFMPSQFENQANPKIHEETTGPEIIEAMGGERLDYFVSGVGTGGTITGAGRALRRKYPQVKIVAVEPEGSPVLSGGSPGPHKIQGIGAGFIPRVYDPEVVDEIIRVSDEDAIKTARKLAKEEGILAGISSGASMYAALTIARSKRGKRIVVILPDTGERYLSTELFEE